MHHACSSSRTASNLVLTLYLWSSGSLSQGCSRDFFRTKRRICCRNFPPSPCWGRGKWGNQTRTLAALGERVPSCPGRRESRTMPGGLRNRRAVLDGRRSGSGRTGGDARNHRCGASLIRHVSLHSIRLMPSWKRPPWPRLLQTSTPAGTPLKTLITLGWVSRCGTGRMD